MYAVVRIRGGINFSKSIRDTLNMLRLKNVNNCVLIEDNPTMKGMLEKAKDLITWGEVNKETIEKLKKKKGDKKVFRLSPPSKGYKSIKKPFPKGDLGYRGDKINDLLERML